MALAVAPQPGRKLKMHQAELATGAQRLERLLDSPPQLGANFRRRVLVVKRSLSRRAERCLDVHSFTFMVKPGGVRSAHSWGVRAWRSSWSPLRPKGTARRRSAGVPRRCCSARVKALASDQGLVGRGGRFNQYRHVEMMLGRTRSGRMGIPLTGRLRRGIHLATVESSNCIYIQYIIPASSAWVVA